MIFKAINKKFYLSLLLVCAIFFLDRISKLYVLNFVEKNQTLDLFKSSYLNITLIWNEGIAFGLFSFDKDYLYSLLSSLIATIIMIILFMAIKSKGFKRYALLVIFSGALGNLYDRFYYKAVPDFIDFHIDEFHWFIFNVADIFITIGVIFMILIELIVNKGSKYEKN